MSGSNSAERARRAAVDLILSPPDIRFDNAHDRLLNEAPLESECSQILTCVPIAMTTTIFGS
jgi:hypothetical protein